jgi:hypothetical protein
MRYLLPSNRRLHPTCANITTPFQVARPNSARSIRRVSPNRDLFHALPDAHAGWCCGNRLAAIRHLFDGLVTGQMVPVKLAASVRRPCYVAPPKVRFAVDSPLERDGFEPSVPHRRCCHTTLIRYRPSARRTCAHVARLNGLIPLPDTGSLLEGAGFELPIPREIDHLLSLPPFSFLPETCSRSAEGTDPVRDVGLMVWLCRNTFAGSCLFFTATHRS